VTGAPLPEAAPGSLDAFDRPVIGRSGFREYDVRWRYPDQINLAGIAALGLGLGTQMQARGLAPDIVLGSDYRSYAPAVRQALALGLVQAGIRVQDIGTLLTPMAYFAQIRLGTAAVAMVTASHNPNGWTGVKMGFAPPLTHGPDEMAELRDIVLGGHGQPRPGGGYRAVPGIAAAYLDDLCGDFRMRRRLRVVSATGNGTAGPFARAMLERIGVEVVGLHEALDASFPNYNPNPEATAMLHDMGRAVRAAGADLAFGFDGDGDRCGVVDAAGRAIFADRLGLVLARDLAPRHPGARLVADVKSTGLLATDPVLRGHGLVTDYWKTGHSHMKRRVQALGAVLGIEKSGHLIFAPPLGHGFDCGLRTALEVCRLLERNPGRTLADLAAAPAPAFATPTLSPPCPDAEKYAVTARIAAAIRAHVAAGGRLGGQPVAALVEVNGIRAALADGGFALVRASSNTPNLVVVCESPASAAARDAILDDIAGFLRAEPLVGDWERGF
jgi:phosphomannomutase/phosphoglucomutase